MQWYFILILSLSKTIRIIYFRNDLFHVIFGIIFKKKQWIDMYFCDLIFCYFTKNITLIYPWSFFSNQRALPATRLSPLFCFRVRIFIYDLFLSNYRYFFKLSSKFSKILQREKQITEQNFQITDVFHQFAVTTF